MLYSIVYLVIILDICNDFRYVCVYLKRAIKYLLCVYSYLKSAIEIALFLFNTSNSCFYHCNLCLIEYFQENKSRFQRKSMYE
jgi:hypothetical protein